MQIEVISGPDTGHVFHFEVPGECLVGRHARCDLRLADAEASRCHARITVDAGRAFIDDMDSRNGTAVNGHTIRHAALGEGDEILIGSSLLRISEMDAAAASEAAESTLRLVDPAVRILASLKLKDADLLAGGAPEASEDMLRENHALRSVCELSGQLASVSDTGVVQRILDRARSVMKADSACVMVRETPEEDWRIHTASDDRDGSSTVRVSRTIIKQALADGSAILSENPLADDRFESSESIVTQRISSAVCVPMKIDEAFRGVLFVNRSNPGRPLDNLDLRFAATVANLLAVFIEKCRFQESLIRQERLAAVGQVIAGLAHYAKNIISGLRLSVSTMQRMVDKERFDMLPSVLKSVDEQERRLSDLILDMLSYAKPREPVRLEMDVGEVLEGTLRPYRDMMTSLKIDLSLEVPQGLPVLMAEKNSLHRVFLNLLLNAVDALKECDESNRSLSVKVEPRESNDAVTVRIRDTGPGIPPETLDKIFGVFFSTKGSKGTGLGLAVSRKLVQEHGGEITVDSELGQWTEFRVTIPAGAPD